MEVIGTPTVDAVILAQTQFSVNVGLRPITPTAGKVALLLSMDGVYDDSISWPSTPAPGMTQIVASNGLSNAPQIAINWQVVANTSGSYSIGSTQAAHFFPGEALVGVALICSGGSPVPPSPAQWTYDEIPTPAPDGVTTTFTLAFPFADGSLLVKVDRLDQTAALASYDGASGTFTLLFAPKVGELVEVTYQGR